MQKRKSGQIGCRVTVAGVLLFLVSVMMVHAQEREALPLPRLDGEITLDGIIDEGVWKQLEALPLTVYRPVYKGTPSEATEIKVGYTKEFLYVMAKMSVSDPADIRTNTLYRDQYSGDDLLAVILDTYNDNENALFFHINPSGTRVDIALSNDAEGDFLDVANFDWNTFWDARTVRTDYGWSAEMRIPFTSLGFQAQGERVTMGIIVYRYMAVNNEVQVYPDISPESVFYKPSEARRIELTGIEDQDPVYFTPYLFGGLEQSPSLNSGGDAYRTKNKFLGDAGFDVKYNLSNYLTLDATVNTDFAQVEVDEQQINLGRFSLFFPEKRQFFQERSSIFNYKLGYQERLFHSRRIGLSETGEPIPIIAGMRLVGRSNGWDIGALNMQTARHGSIPSENFGVARLRRQVFNPFSYAGGMLTSRYDVEGNYNVAYGLDGIFRIQGNDYLSVQWSQTFDSEVREADLLEAGLGRLRWERRQQQGLNYFTDVTWSGPEYRPELGFLLRRDVTKLVGNISYGWLQDEESAIRIATPSLPWLLVFRNGDGSVESGFARHQWTLEYKSGSVLTAGLEGYYEDIRSRLSFPENTFVPAGSYDFYRADFFYTMALARLFRVNAGVSAGTFYDGERMNVTFSPVWNISKYLELSGIYQFNTVRFSDRNQSFDTHLGQFRLRSAFNSKASLHSFIQYNSAADFISANIRFRYNFREGNDLWIVYNEGLNTNRNRQDPFLPVSGGRSFQIKYTHTFIW